MKPMSLLERVMPGLFGAPNVHPLFVHFPIVLWLVALLAWGVGLARKKDGLVTAGRWLTHLALVSAFVTVVTGLMAAESLGHDSPGHDLVHTHKKFMLTTTALGLVTSLVAHLMRARTGLAARALPPALLLATVIVMTLGADRGGLLVYRYSIGTRGDTPPGGQHDHDHGPVAERTDGHGHEHGPPAAEPSDGAASDSGRRADTAAPEGDGHAHEHGGPPTRAEVSPEHEHAAAQPPPEADHGRDHGTQDGRGGATPQTVQVGEQVPDMALPDLEGQVHTLREHLDRGEVLALVWLDPSRLPALPQHERDGAVQEAYGRFHDDVTWVAVCSFSRGEAQGQVGKQTDLLHDVIVQLGRQAKEHVGIYDLILLDEGGRVAERFGVSWVPHVVLIDKAGLVAFSRAIDLDSASDELVTALERALDGEPRDSVPAPHHAGQGSTVPAGAAREADE